MQPWQRFLNAVSFNQVDYVPVVLIGTPRFYASLAGLRLFDCLHDPCKMLEVQRQAFAKFPEVIFIPGCWPDYGTGLFTAWGGRICWEDNGTPSVREKYLKSEDQIKEFSLPNPESDGLMPWHLQTLRMFASRKEEFGDNLHCVHCNGPGELASYLWGMTQFLTDVTMRPNLMKELLKKVTETIIAWLTAQSKILGDAQAMLITDDVSGMLSPEMYREFLLPYHLHIREKFDNLIYIFHCDTKLDHIVSILPEAGIDVYQVGPTTDLAGTKNKIGDKICLMGNLDGVTVMQSRDTKLVRKAAETCLSQAMTGSGYLLSAGGGLNEDTPEENIRVLIEVAQSKGRYR